MTGIFCHGEWWPTQFGATAMPPAEVPSISFTSCGCCCITCAHSQVRKAVKSWYCSENRFDLAGTPGLCGASCQSRGLDEQWMAWVQCLASLGLLKFCLLPLLSFSYKPDRAQHGEVEMSTIKNSSFFISRPVQGANNMFGPQEWVRNEGHFLAPLGDWESMTQWGETQGLSQANVRMGGVCFSDRGPLRVTLPTSWPEGASTAFDLHVPSSSTFSAVWDPGVRVLSTLFSVRQSKQGCTYGVPAIFWAWAKTLPVLSYLCSQHMHLQSWSFFCSLKIFPVLFTEVTTLCQASGCHWRSAPAQAWLASGVTPMVRFGSWGWKASWCRAWEWAR